MNESIDLDAAPHFSFPGSTFTAMPLKHNLKMGRVQVERSGDVLCIGGRNVTLQYYTRDNSAKLYPRDHVFREDLRGCQVLNAALGGFLIENPEYIPNKWRSDSAGASIAYTMFSIIFRGTFFKHRGGSLYVFGMSLNLHGVWYPRYVWLGAEYQFNCAHAVMDP